MRIKLPSLLLQPRCILAQSGKYRDIRHDERPRLHRGHSSCRMSPLAMSLPPCAGATTCIHLLLLGGILAPRPLPCKLHSCLAAWLPGWGGEHSYRDGQNSFPVNERVTIKEICLNSVRRQSLLLFLKQLNFPTKLFSLLQPRCILAQPGKYRDIRHDERPRLRRGHSSCRMSPLAMSLPSCAPGATHTVCHWPIGEAAP